MKTSTCDTMKKARSASVFYAPAAAEMSYGDDDLDSVDAQIASPLFQG